jgi:hypothetical protein
MLRDIPQIWIGPSFDYHLVLGSSFWEWPHPKPKEGEKKEKKLQIFVC